MRPIVVVGVYSTGPAAEHFFLQAFLKVLSVDESALQLITGAMHC